jgi:putative intracellular protease/amidase/YHS domain-containing protein
MNRRHVLQRAAALTLGSLPLFTARASRTPEAPLPQPSAAAPLRPPAAGPIPVAVLLSGDAVVIDFCGPWEVFENAAAGSHDAPAFQLYTVAESTAALRASGGLQVVPDFTFATAPAPRVVVIPAQSGAGPAALEWIRHASRTSDVTMSVCTGAFVLARTGLLDGKAATTHHNAYTEFAMTFPDIALRRGARFVEAGNLATAGGLSSGIDLSLRVVERYFGREVAQKTAFYMEYQGQGWLDPNSNQAYRAHRVLSAAQPFCPVCEMDVDPPTAPHSQFRGQTYYFCMPGHKTAFERAPENYLAALAS